jgi:succinate dehydrogenase/fumarate reductase flavoprotein subunit
LIAEPASSVPNASARNVKSWTLMNEPPPARYASGAAREEARLPEQRTLNCDVLVAGSGAGGMAAAVTARKLGLDVVVAEKEPWFGGTTALSGGWLWVPGNSLGAHRMALAGTHEAAGAARTYLEDQCGPWFDAVRVDAFLAAAPRMVEFFMRETAVRLECPVMFPDYHPDSPGGAPGGRSIVAAPFDGRALGASLAKLRPPLPELTLFGMMLGSGKEIVHFFNATRSAESAWVVAKRMAAHARDLLVYRRGIRLTNGNALAGRLLKSADDAGVRLMLSAPVCSLVRADGAVRGALLEPAGGTVRVHARRGIVLACGGFPHDVSRRRRLFPHASTGVEHWSPAPAGNTGDGLRLAESAGAHIEQDLPNAAAWVPVSRVPRGDGTTGLFPHFIDRAKPGVVAVTRRGHRFVNEADSYHDFVQAMMAAIGRAGEPTAFLLADHRAIRRYGLGFAKAFPLPLTPHLRSGYLLRGATPAELAERAGIDAAALQITLDEYNRHARAGRDPAFGKGGTAYNRFLGDASVAPNPCVAPLDEPPYYAVQIVIGDLGTYAGIRTDGRARVLGERGQPIPGLYAAGNDMSSIMGGNYPAGGITLGPAMTFGYIAGCDLAGVAP